METLKDISWSSYLATVLVFAIAYYGLVLAVCFRKQIANKLKAKQQAPQELEEDNDGEPMNELETLVQDIERMLIAGQKHTKAELLNMMAERVAAFGWLGRPGYRYALNNFIIEKAQTHCGAEFSEEELEERWSSLLR